MAPKNCARRSDRIGIYVDADHLPGAETQRRDAVQTPTATNVEKPPTLQWGDKTLETLDRLVDLWLCDLLCISGPVLTERAK
jgi:hypothetical protein